MQRKKSSITKYRADRFNAYVVPDNYDIKAAQLIEEFNRGGMSQEDYNRRLIEIKKNK